MCDHRPGCGAGRARRARGRALREVSPTKRRLAGEAAWVFVGQVASAVASLVGVRLITEAVAPGVYGRVALVLGAIALAQGVAVNPVAQALLRYYTEYADRHEGSLSLRRAAVGVLWRPMGASAALLVLGILLWSRGTSQGLLLALASVALYAVEVIRSLELVLLNAARRQREMAKLVATDAWLRVFVAVWLVRVAGAQPSMVVGGYFIGAAIALGCFYVRARGVLREWRAAMRRSDGGARPGPALWGYARPLVALPLVGWVSGLADRYIIGGIAGLGAAGVYSAVYGAASKPFLMFGGGVELAMRPVYYERVSANDPDGERRILRAWMAIVLVGGLALLGLIGTLHRQLAALLLAPAYREHSVLMFWIGAGYVLLMCAQVMTRVSYAWHDTKGVLFVEGAGALASILVGVPMVRAFGVSGAAWAVPVYFGVQFALAGIRASGARRRGAVVGTGSEEEASSSE